MFYYCEVIKEKYVTLEKLVASKLRTTIVHANNAFNTMIITDLRSIITLTKSFVSSLPATI